MNKSQRLSIVILGSVLSMNVQAEDLYITTWDGILIGNEWHKDRNESCNNVFNVLKSYGVEISRTITFKDNVKGNHTAINTVCTATTLNPGPQISFVKVLEDKPHPIRFTPTNTKIKEVMFVFQPSDSSGKNTNVKLPSDAGLFDKNGFNQENLSKYCKSEKFNSNILEHSKLVKIGFKMSSVLIKDIYINDPHLAKLLAEFNQICQSK